MERAFRLAFQRAPTAAEREKAAAHLQRMTSHHRTAAAAPLPPLAPLVRTAVVEQTGERVQIEEESDPSGYERNLHPSQVSPETRALAELCLVLLNSNEFAYVY